MYIFQTPQKVQRSAKIFYLMLCDSLLGTGGESHNLGKRLEPISVLDGDPKVWGKPLSYLSLIELRDTVNGSEHERGSKQGRD